MENIVTEKKCTRCGEVKQVTEFHKEKKSLDGLRAACKKCRNNQYDEYRKENREKILNRGREYHRKNHDLYLERSRRYHLNNIEKEKERKRLYRKNNPEKAKAASRANHLKNREKELLKAREWKNNNKDRVKEKASLWRVLNPEKRRGYQRNRRALKLGSSGGKITAREWEELKRYYNYTCLKCKRKEPEIKITLDHIIPLKLGGRHEISNAQPLCISCNASKKIKIIDYR